MDGAVDAIVGPLKADTRVDMSTPSSSTTSLDSTLVSTPELAELSLKDMVVSDDDKAAAALLKDKANASFKGASSSQLTRLYRPSLCRAQLSRCSKVLLGGVSAVRPTLASLLTTSRIEKNPLDATLYSNRACSLSRVFCTVLT